MSITMHTPAGSLDGKTIVRFSHCFTDGAGIENHLAYLNRELLCRNAMNIIQIYMHSDKSVSTESISLGKGTLLKIPLPSIPRNNIQSKRMTSNLLFKRLYSISLHTPVMHLSDSLKFILYRAQIRIRGENYRQFYEKRFQEFEHLDVVIEKIFTRSKVDLVVNHFAGGKDSLLLMQTARHHSIPVLVINHFHNRWLNYIPIREQLNFATLTAGVSGQHIPRYIRNRFVNLSNGVDTFFFQRRLATPPDNFFPNHPVVLLPARIEHAKGHLDILKAACVLKKKGKPIQLVFIGRIDSNDYKEQLIEFTNKHDLQDHVEFIGQVDQITLRKWYSIADIIVLPSYQEGCGRVLLEAQSMEIPPVAYNTGGTPEAVIDNETGFLVEHRNIGKLASKIEQLINDPQLRKVMGRRGREFVEKKFSLSALAQRHELTYFNIINNTATLL